MSSFKVVIELWWIFLELWRYLSHTWHCTKLQLLAKSPYHTPTETSLAELFTPARVAVKFQKETVKRSSSNHPFLGAFAVSFRVGFHDFFQQTSHSVKNAQVSSLIFRLKLVASETVSYPFFAAIMSKIAMKHLPICRCMPKAKKETFVNKCFLQQIMRVSEIAATNKTSPLKSGGFLRRFIFHQTHWWFSQL